LNLRVRVGAKSVDEVNHGGQKSFSTGGLELGGGKGGDTGESRRLLGEGSSAAKPSAVGRGVGINVA